MERGNLSTDDLAGRGEQDAQTEAFDERDAGRGGELAQDDVDPASPGEEFPALLDDREAEAFLDRWRDVQVRFVDDPQGAVRDGDSLVAELMQSLAQRFSERKSGLEEQWNRGGEPETEQLRHALQEYRSFFNRLLST
jgi:hypothetical protein